jgi:hypothetical protein
MCVCADVCRCVCVYMSADTAHSMSLMLMVAPEDVDSSETILLDDSCPADGCMDGARYVF